MSNNTSRPSESQSIDCHVGRRLRLVRELNELSQSELASRLGISIEQLARHEIGTERIPASKLFKAASILCVPGPWFFEDLASAIKDNALDGIEIQEQVIDLTALIRLIADRGQPAALVENAQSRLDAICNNANGV